MTRTIENLKTNLHTNAMKWALAVAAVTCFAPALASAQVHDYRRYDRGDRYDHRHHDHGDFRFGIGFGTPAYGQRVERIWVEPVYRTEVDRAWIEPVYRTQVDRVWVEPVYEDRDVTRYDYGRRVTYRQRVLVRPGCWEDRPRQILISEGCWKTVERQVLVRAGYWDERIVSTPAYGPVWGFNFGYRK